MCWAAMSEATIYENGEAHAWKCHINANGANVRKSNLVVDAKAQAAPV